MTAYALYLFVLYTTAVVLGAVVYKRAPYAQTNRLFSIFCLSIAVQSFMSFGYQNSRTYEDALLWWDIDFLWPFYTPLALHFVLSVVNWESLLKKRATLAFIYLPAIFFAVSDVGWHAVSGPPVRHPWGWRYSLPDPNPVFYAAYIWLHAVLLFTIFAAVRGIVLEKNTIRRRHILVALSGSAIGLSSSIADVVVQQSGREMPPLYDLSMIFVLIFFAYATWKHHMFSLTPVTAAEKILETMTDALLLVDTRHRIISLNKAATAMLGWTEEELTKKRIQTLIPDLQGLPDWLTGDSPSKTSGTERMKDLETAFLHKNGHLIPVSLAGAITKNKDNSVIGYLLIGRDITERKQTREELERHQERLEDLVERRTKALKNLNINLQKEIEERRLAEKERTSLQNQLFQSQKLEAVGRLAGGVAHDFNNLLTVIGSYADILLTELMPDDPNREDVSEIFQAYQRAAALTGQLLAFSRKQVTEPKVVEINGIIEGIGKMLRRIMGEDLKLVFEPGAEPLHLIIDPNQLEQVLVNLLVNARDAMPKGGRVEIIAGHCPTDKVRALKQTDYPKALHLCVKDNGCGMNEETKKKIFEPFFTTKAVGKGTGLGLSTVYGIIKQNGGHIEVESTEGVGTTFHIYLPLADPDFNRIDAPVETWAPVGFEKILLVEDEDSVRRVVHTILKRQGYDVQETSNADEALKILSRENHGIELLLTDVVMPGMSGRTLAEQVKAENPEMRVVFMSGYNDEIIDHHGLVQRGVHLIQKPFESVGLCLKVREALDETEAHSRLRKVASNPSPSLMSHD